MQLRAHQFGDLPPGKNRRPADGEFVGIASHRLGGPHRELSSFPAGQLAFPSHFYKTSRPRSSYS